ncbi:MAG TPA: hypothetical protein VFO19_02225 [Vicinamibacterales bacterium]|nr:hypothetical protein [Vicinamibacterales bacterium]
MRTHVKVIAVLFLLMGTVLVIIAAFSSLFFGALATYVGAQDDPDAATGQAVLGLTGAAASAFFVIYSIPNFVTGIGLLKFRPWARIFAIVLAVLALIRFPFGTAFGIYALWVLFRKDTEALFV